MTYGSPSARLTKRGVRAPRMPAELLIEARTLGTNQVYELGTVDVSRSGILVSWSRRGRMPYLVNTILEITIDPECSMLSAPVFCLAKVVRRDVTKDDRTHTAGELGIQILQMDQSDATVWENCVTALEQSLLAMENTLMAN